MTYLVERWNISLTISTTNNVWAVQHDKTNLFSGSNINAECFVIGAALSFSVLPERIAALLKEASFPLVSLDGVEIARKFLSDDWEWNFSLHESEPGYWTLCSGEPRLFSGELGNINAFILGLSTAFSGLPDSVTSELKHVIAE